MAAEFSHCVEAFAFAKALTPMPNLIQLDSRTYFLDDFLQAHSRISHQAVCIRFQFTDAGHGGAVAISSIQEDGDVKVDDIPTFQWPGVRHSMQGHFIWRSAEAAGESIVVDSHWITSAGDDELAGLAVNLVRCHPLLCSIAGHDQGFCCKTTSTSHLANHGRGFLFGILFRLQGSWDASRVIGVGGARDVIWHLHWWRYFVSTQWEGWRVRPLYLGQLMGR
mmetsp:Transcript_59213/g.138632  ORF Transcript_59213/g.138632 Transcript_59213/m.138632 type:complete len:222 (-) Transcript_59213:109-774(-)